MDHNGDSPRLSEYFCPLENIWGNFYSDKKYFPFCPLAEYEFRKRVSHTGNVDFTFERGKCGLVHICANRNFYLAILAGSNGNEQEDMQANFGTHDTGSPIEDLHMPVQMQENQKMNKLQRGQWVFYGIDFCEP